ncbi:queuine tRNA-ribosyltransferase accessory subunit 2-like [Rhagoletis pomonella]|uniref:queuine tRNA-ribosyltransferase accessory subunit 2-like n=1 Tax=Rhagoletis pomonella TaxID=28610 RepID=UPI001785FEE8|nr:queuine tRNA-ribosyltransferase accessory subunit 2-like [Rhagoletis pomonella]
MTDSVKLFNDSLSAYVGYPECLSLLMVRDPCEVTPSGYNDKNTVPLFTRRGKEKLDPKRYMDVVESLTPDIYQGLCDADTNVGSSKKRLTKSVHRTTQFMDICYDRHKNSNNSSKCTLFALICNPIRRICFREIFFREIISDSTFFYIDVLHSEYPNFFVGNFSIK